MGQYTRGGGAGRDPKPNTGPLHEAALAALRHSDRAVYERTRREVEALMRRHLTHAKPKSVIDRLTPQQQTDYLLSLFAGSAWYIAREKAARIVAEADKDTIARANALLPELFAEAANRFHAITEADSISAQPRSSRGSSVWPSTSQPPRAANTASRHISSEATEASA